MNRKVESSPVFGRIIPCIMVKKDYNFEQENFFADVNSQLYDWDKNLQAYKQEQYHGKKNSI